MSSQQPIALVTGANRGIGKEVSRQLAAKGMKVLLTARSLEKAQNAVQELGSSALIPAQLDVTDLTSIATLHEYVAQEHGQLDVLINNAAIHYDTWQRVENADPEVILAAFSTNVFGPWQLIKTFLNLLRQSPQPRIVNVSSRGGALESLDGSTPAYSLTKASLNALTIMLGRALRRDRVLINAVCPGWVATDMGGQGGRTVAEGAQGIVWAAMLPDDGPTGGFFRDGQPIPW